MMRMVGALLAGGLLGVGWAAAEEVGEVSTVFHMFSPDHKIVVEAFDDPKIAGVACYLARADAGVPSRARLLVAHAVLGARGAPLPRRVLHVRDVHRAG